MEKACNNYIIETEEDLDKAYRLLHYMIYKKYGRFPENTKDEMQVLSDIVSSYCLDKIENSKDAKNALIGLMVKDINLFHNPNHIKTTRRNILVTIQAARYMKPIKDVEAIATKPPGLSEYEDLSELHDIELTEKQVYEASKKFS